MQLAAVEKTEIRKNLKRGSSQTEMDRVVSEWRRLTHRRRRRRRRRRRAATLLFF
jgi:hypothetical protein